MKNNEIIESIKNKLNGDKQHDVRYLQEQLRHYQAQGNFDVVYGIQLLLFNYLSSEEKAKLNNDATSMLKEHKVKYEKALELLNYGEVDKAQNILMELYNIYEKVGKLKGANFYDFSEPIECLLYFGSVENIKKARIKKVPEPVVHYAYQIASIYLEKNDTKMAINYLERALLFNPICQYVLEELVQRYINVNDYDQAFKYVTISLKYAYTKQQLAYCYKQLGNIFKFKNRFDIAIASFALSNIYVDELDNKIKIKEITDKVGLIKFGSADELIELFKKENLNYGPSKHVISTFKNFIETAKAQKDQKTLKYVLDIALKLTDEEYFKKELESLK